MMLVKVFISDCLNTLPAKRDEIQVPFSREASRRPTRKANNPRRAGTLQKHSKRINNNKKTDRVPGTITSLTQGHRSKVAMHFPGVKGRIAPEIDLRSPIDLRSR